MEEIKGHIRTWADIEALEDGLTEAEEKLIEAARAGETCVLGLEVPPEVTEGNPDGTVHIRAPVLRYVLLGGCDAKKTDPAGVSIFGAHVTGELDVSNLKLTGEMFIVNSRFDEELRMGLTKVKVLILNDSHLTSGLWAQGLDAEGNVFLHGISTEASVELNSAIIGGQLDCTDASFCAEKGEALNAQRITTKESVLLRGITAEVGVAVNGANIGGQLDCTRATFNAKEGNALNAQGITTKADLFLRGIAAKATVDVNGANIGGQLDCEGATFNAKEGHALSAQGITTKEDVFLTGITAEAKVDLNGASIGGQLSCIGATFNAKEGDALNALGLTIGRELVWRGVTTPHAALEFRDAHAAVLVDDETSWPAGGRTYLDGFTYGRIIEAATDAETRLKWIAKSERPGRFVPQPYTHLAKVLREKGHERDAREILIGRERRHSWHRRQKFRVALDGTVSTGLKSVWYDLRRFLPWAWDSAARLGAGYGYKPFRTVLVIAALVCSTWLFSAKAYHAGDFAPNSAVVQLSDEWVFLAETARNPAADWSAETAAGRDWETFNGLIYAADVVVPIINFGQTEAWAPSTTRGGWGWHLWWFKSVMALAGWIITAIGAAAITGIIRRE